MRKKRLEKPSAYHQIRFYFLFNPLTGLAIVSSLIALACAADINYNEKSSSIASYAGYFAAFILFYLNYRARSMHNVFQILTEFNKRYSEIKQSASEYNNKKTGAFIQDYINLCAEEYYYYIQGQIPTQVWSAWHAGMKAEWSKNDIKEHAKNEFENLDLSISTSYYNFNPYHLGLLEGSAERSPPKGPTLTSA